MNDIEVLLIDACAMLPGLTVIEFFELGSLDYFHAIIEDMTGNLFEFDIAGWFADFDHPQDDEIILEDLISRLRETCDLYEE